MSGFVDEITITVKSGHGGAGSVSFRREKYVPRGGPDGGDGGKGGDCIFVIQENLKTLTHLRNLGTYKGENGQPGSGRKRHGSDGKPVIILVPPGTRIWDATTNELLMDLLDLGQFTFLQGGIGGKGNTHFATSRHQAPRFAQDGMPGEERLIRLELQLIADIGFVGLPNAGKSSLLASLTSAHPKVGPYPFTTKIPNLGVMSLHQSDIVLADIPGILEGASQGHGLGIRFLKHIARTKALAFIIDGSDETEPLSKVFDTLLKELETYDPDLKDKPRVIFINKIDIPEANNRVSQAKEKDFPGEQVLGISALSRIHLDQAAQELYRLAETLPKTKNSVADSTILTPDWMKDHSEHSDHIPEIHQEVAQDSNHEGSLSKKLIDQVLDPNEDW
jgi:GTP-binding protein